MPHIHDKIDFTAEVLVIYGNAVLLRKHDKYKKWLSVGGHIELNEDPTEAAIREVKEEVGLDIELFGNAPRFNKLKEYRELIPPVSMNRHRINEIHEHVTLLYFARSASNKITQGDKEISDEIRWFTKEELDDPQYGIEEDIKLYAKKALEELAG